MDKQDVLYKLKKLAQDRMLNPKGFDRNDVRVEAGEIIFEFLISLGHQDVIDVYNEIFKWVRLNVWKLK